MHPRRKINAQGLFDFRVYQTQGLYTVSSTDDALAILELSLLSEVHTEDLHISGSPSPCFNAKTYSDFEKALKKQNLKWLQGHINIQC